MRPVAVLTWEPSALLAPPAASAFRDQEVGLLKTGLTGTSGIKASRTRTRSRTQTCRSGQGLPNQAGTGEGEGRRTEQLVCTLPGKSSGPKVPRLWHLVGCSENLVYSFCGHNHVDPLHHVGGFGAWRPEDEKLSQSHAQVPMLLLRNPFGSLRRRAPVRVRWQGST